MSTFDAQGMVWSRFRKCFFAVACMLTLVLPCQAQSSIDDLNRGANASPNIFRIAVPGNVFAKLGKDGPEGILLQATDALLRRMGKVPTYVLMPTSDALNDLKSGAVNAATVVVPTRNLENTVWLSDPIVTESSIVVALKDKKFTLNKLSDLHGKTIGGRVGYRYALVENDPNMRLIRYASDGEMLRSLLFGVTDVSIISAIADVYAFRSEGIMKWLSVLGKKSVGTVPLVVAFSKKSMSEVQFKEFNQLWQGYKSTPEWDNIVERHGLADLMDEWPLIEDDRASIPKWWFFK